MKKKRLNEKKKYIKSRCNQNFKIKEEEKKLKGIDIK